MSIATFDQGFCARIESRVADVLGSRRYAMWFDGSAKFDFDEDERTLIVAVPNQFAADWIGRHFDQQLQLVARQELGDGVTVKLRVDAVAFASVDTNDTLADASPKRGELIKPTTQRPAQAGTAASPALADTPSWLATRGPASRDAVNLRHRLEDFIVGSSNELAYAAACRMGDDDHLIAGHPLFVHGGCGLGKTHLLQGICRRLMEKDPAARIHYTTGEQFTNSYITAVRANKLDAFRNRMRKLDLLAVDDVHFIANKQATQQEFLHSFDHIELGGARVVLASDSHPKLIAQFTEALVSRCMRGLVLQINNPDAQTRLRLVCDLAERRDMLIRPSVAQALAGHCNGSVRDIEGMLTKLHALASLDSDSQRKGDAIMQPIGHRLIDRLLQSDANTTHHKPVRFEAVMHTVATQLGVEAGQIIGPSRHRHIVLARSLVIYITRKLTTMSYPEIATAMGRRNHSTIITATQRTQRLLEKNQPLQLPGELTPITPTDLVDRLRHAIHST